MRLHFPATLAGEISGDGALVLLAASAHLDHARWSPAKLDYVCACFRGVARCSGGPGVRVHDWRGLVPIDFPKPVFFFGAPVYRGAPNLC